MLDSIIAYCIQLSTNEFITLEINMELVVLMLHII